MSGSEYLDEARFDFNPRSNDPSERSVEAARHAIELDPHGSAHAHQALFWTYAAKGEITTLKAIGEHALTLNPYHMEVMVDLGTYLSFVGEWSQGIPLVRRATALDPGTHGAYYLTLFSDALRRQDYPAAWAEANAIAMKMPFWYWSHAVLAIAHGFLGHRAAAQAEVSKLLHLNPNFSRFAPNDYQGLGLAPALFDNFREGLLQAGLRVARQG